MQENNNELLSNRFYSNSDRMLGRSHTAAVASGQHQHSGHVIDKRDVVPQMTTDSLTRRQARPPDDDVVSRFVVEPLKVSTLSQDFTDSFQPMAKLTLPTSDLVSAEDNSNSLKWNCSSARDGGGSLSRFSNVTRSISPFAAVDDQTSEVRVICYSVSDDHVIKPDVVAETVYPTADRTSADSGCARIEPSPLRTLGMSAKRHLNKSTPDLVLLFDKRKASTNSGPQSPLAVLSAERRSWSVDDLTDDWKSQQTSALSPTVTKLNRFFGEEKPTATAIERAVFELFMTGSNKEKQLVKGRKSFSKALTSKFVANSISAMNGVGSSPSLTDRAIVSSKHVKNVIGSSRAVSTTWRGKMYQHFKRLQENKSTSDSAAASSPDSPNKTFGIPLEMCLTSKNVAHLPLIVEVCVEIIESIGIDSPGLYRIPGHMSSVTELVDEVEQRADPECIITLNSRWNDVNVVASLLKLFLRRLPEGLITDDLYESFIAASRQTDESSVLVLKRLLRELPERNFATLSYLMHHLQRVSQHSGVNKMNAHNLAIMFGPSLVRPGDEAVCNLLQDIDAQSTAVERFIEHCEWYFDDTTTDSCPPSVVKFTEQTMTTTNLLLLPNTEALLEAVSDNDLSSPSSVEEPLHLRLFSFGSGRHSQKKAKKKKQDADAVGDGGVDASRELELKPSSKWPQSRRSLKQSKSMKVVSTGKSSKDGDVVDGNDNTLSDLNGSRRVVEEKVVDIKRYPAYNFVDTTIKLSQSSMSRSLASLPDAMQYSSITALPISPRILYPHRSPPVPAERRSLKKPVPAPRPSLQNKESSSVRRGSTDGVWDVMGSTSPSSRHNWIDDELGARSERVAASDHDAFTGANGAAW